MRSLNIFKSHIIQYAQVRRQPNKTGRAEEPWTIFYKK